MAFFKCPRCQSENVKNFHLNTDEYGNPTDGTAQGCCYDCDFEEPTFYHEKGHFYYTEYPINIGNGYVRKAKPKRKRKIEQAIKTHAIPLMNLYFNNEHTLAVSGTSILSDKKTLEIANTLSGYAHILSRNFDENAAIYKNEWAKLVRDFH